VFILSGKYPPVTLKSYISDAIKFLAGNFIILFCRVVHEALALEGQKGLAVQ